MNDLLPPNETDRLKSLASLEVLHSTAEENFDEVTELVCRLIHVPMAAITFVGEEKVWFKSVLGIDINEIPRDQAFCAHVALSGATLVVPDARLDARFVNLQAVSGPPHILFYAGEPILDDEGHVLGAVCAMDFAPRELSADELKILKLLARNVFQQLKLRRDVIRLERENPSLGRLHNLTQSYLDRSRYEVVEMKCSTEGIRYLMKNKSVIRTCAPRGHSSFRDKLEKALTSNECVDFQYDQVKVKVEVVQRGRTGRNVFSMFVLK